MIQRILKLIDSITAAQRKLPQAPQIISPEEEKNITRYGAFAGYI